MGVGAGAQLERHPLNLDIFAFDRLFQRSLRQETVRSNVVGENQNRQRHSSILNAQRAAASLQLGKIFLPVFVLRRPGCWRVSCSSVRSCTRRILPEMVLGSEENSMRRTRL